MSRITLLGVFFTGVFLGLGLFAPLSADFVVFKIPTTNISFVLQGKATLSKSQLMSFVHVSKQTFDLPQAGSEVITLPSLREMAAKKLSSAKGMEADTLAAAAWALDHGLLTEFHRGVDQLLQANSSQAFGTQAKLLKEELSKPIADDPTAEAALLKQAGNSEAKVVKSNHFLLAAPPIVNEKGAVKRKKPEARLEQLELLLEVFIMKCAERGLPVQVPKQRLLVASVASVPSAGDATLRTRPRDASIHWSPSQNILFINDAAKITALAPLKTLQDKVAEAATAPKPKRNAYGSTPANNPAPAMTTGASGGGLTFESISQMRVTDLQKLTASVQSLMAIGVENFELESISREAAYSFTSNCGVLPASAPQWLRDGLATYFELPSEVGWVKIGDIGQIREAWYLASLQDPERISISDIVCGHCHEGTLTANEAMRATTQSWALVHFLLQEHPAGITKFLNNLRTLPPDIKTADEVTMGIFDEAFGVERAALEESWRTYILAQKAEYKALKPDGETSSTAQN